MRLRRPIVTAVATLVFAATALAVSPTARAQTVPGVDTHPPKPNTAGAPAAGGHGRFSRAPIDLGPPNLPLAVAFVVDGAGSSSLTEAERAVLVKRFGAADVTTFEQTARFVATDAPARISDAGYTLPAQPSPPPTDAHALTSALYDAGLAGKGRYDAEYMLDDLLSHIVHVQVMDDIDASAGLGPKADATYHRVLGQIIMDAGRP